MASDTQPLPNRDGDWLWAQARYENTTLSCDEIGREISQSATSVVSRASRYGWTRNKRQSVVERSAELTLAAKISKEEELRLRFEQVEKVNAAMQAEVLQVHRQDIKVARQICNDLWTDLKEARAQVDPDTRMDLMDTSMVINRLSTAMKNLILLERQAYGIIGAIEDPEIPTQSPQVSVDVLGVVLEKFGKVLQFNREAPTFVLENNPSSSNGPAS